MYGGVEKTPAMKEADKKLVETVLAHGETRESGARRAVRRGFDALHQGDLSTAIKRFNQAWLLDPKFGGAYWGFATILAERDRKVSAAERMFERAKDLLPQDADLEVDYGQFMGKSNRPQSAIEHFKRALALNPAARDAQAGLATAYAELGDFAQALVHAKISVERKEYLPPAVVPAFACMAELLEKNARPTEAQQRACLSKASAR